MTEKKELNFSVIFTSLDEYSKSSEFKEIYNTINDTNSILEQQDFFRSVEEDHLSAPISFTRS